MVARVRVVSLASALALIGSLATAVDQAGAAAQSPGGALVTFSSQSATLSAATEQSKPATEAISQSASAQGQSTAEQVEASLDSAGDRSAFQLTPKSRGAGQSGVPSDNTVSTASRVGTPAATASFIGQQASNITCSYFAHGCNPPDMAVAASPQFVLQGVNTQWEVLDPSGAVEPGWPVSAQTFFGVTNDTNTDGSPCDTAHGSQPFLSDPRAAYDATDGRFWASMLQIAHVPALGVAPDCPFQSTMWVAVSQTSDPSGSWNVYRFNTSLDGVFFNDFDQIGLNSEAVFISLNMFRIDDKGNVTGFYAELFEGNKARMEAGRTDFTADAFFNLQATGPSTRKVGGFLADTVQPAVNLDSSAGGGEKFMDTFDGPDPMNGHFCSGFGDQCSGLALWTLTNPIAHDSGGAAPTLTAQYVPTRPYAFPPPSTQPSCSRCVDASDLRISGTTTVRNGVFYGAWETAIQNGTTVVPGIEWAQVALGNVGGTSTGYYDFAGDASASYGDLMPDAQGNVVMVFEHMSSTVFPETRYIVKAANGNFHGAGALLRAGDASYRAELCGTAGLPVCRWGDYEATSFDGSGHIWFAGQYANVEDLASPQFGRNWGTWIGAISAS